MRALEDLVSKGTVTETKSRAETTLPIITQETLAQMVGTTRSRVHFMNKFKELGFVAYGGGLAVDTGLLSVLLHDGLDGEPSVITAGPNPVFPTH
jgi:hypothetical protein